MTFIPKREPPPRVGYYDRACEGDTTLDIAAARALWRPIRDALEQVHLQATAATEAARKADPKTTGWDMADTLETIQAALFDANHALAELDKADRVTPADGDEYDALRQHCADKRWHEGRVL